MYSKDKVDTALSFFIWPAFVLAYKSGDQT